jgi:predicted DNA-binding transcriptional regulator AlpA
MERPKVARNAEGQGGPDRLITPAEAARILGVSRSTLWRLSRQPGFPRGKRLLGCVRYSLAGVWQWADQQ